MAKKLRMKQNEIIVP